jgi:16S rRNA G527 N7-methylase RsmG
MCWIWYWVAFRVFPSKSHCLTYDPWIPYEGLFLEEAVRTLALEHTIVVNDRAERVKGKLSGNYDFVLARAVTDLTTLWTWSMPLLRKGGSLLAQKGGDLQSELDRLSNSYPSLHPQQLQYPKSWAIEPSRCIIVIEKEYSGGKAFATKT